MKYENLEQEYEIIFKHKVLPFIKTYIIKDFKTEPVYYLLENLKINRFRSGLPLIIAREFKFSEHKIIPLSALFELTFTTALAQDDFYDDDLKREGLIATHKKFGVKQTLASCDYVNHKIIQLVPKILSQYGVDHKTINSLMIKINEEISKAYSSVLMELKSKDNLFKVNEEEIKELYLAKTAHGRMLLECCFFLCGRQSGELQSIRNYANDLAMAGQLKNDIYDYIKHRKFRGLSDLRQGHITYPIFLLLKEIKKKDRTNFTKQLKKKNYKFIIKLLKNNLILDKMLDLINFYVEDAKLIVMDELQSKDYSLGLKNMLNTWAEGNRNFSVKIKI